MALSQGCDNTRLEHNLGLLSGISVGARRIYHRPSDILVMKKM